MGRENMKGRGQAGVGRRGRSHCLWLGLLSSSFVMLCNLCAYNRPLPIEWFFLVSLSTFPRTTHAAHLTRLLRAIYFYQVSEQPSFLKKFITNPEKSRDPITLGFLLCINAEALKPS